MIFYAQECLKNCDLISNLIIIIESHYYYDDFDDITCVEFDWLNLYIYIWIDIITEHETI